MTSVLQSLLVPQELKQMLYLLGSIVDLKVMEVIQLAQNLKQTKANG